MTIRLLFSTVAALITVCISFNSVAALNDQLADAARRGDLKVIQRADLTGTALNDHDADGYTLLILAVYHDNAPVISYLLSRGADPNQADNRGRTALMGAAFKGDIPAADVLLDDPRTQINLQNAQGQTAAMYAALFGHQEFLKHLVNKGARLDIRDNRGNTAASLAEAQGNQPLADWINQHIKG